MAISASRLSFLRGRTNNQHCNAMFCHDAKRKSKVEQMRTRQTKTLLIVWKILQKVAQIVDLMARRKSEAICYNNQEILGWTGRGCLLFFYTASSPLLIWRKIFSSLAIWMAVLKKYLIVDIWAKCCMLVNQPDRLSLFLVTSSSCTGHSSCTRSMKF